MAGFDLDGVFDEDDYGYFYFGDEKRSGAASDAEAAQVASLLNLQPGQQVLDAPCGHGRIAQRLAQRGIRMVGVDRAPHFIRAAREAAGALALDIDYRLGDLRELALNSEFDAAFNWFTGFGYFDDETDRDILRRYHAALRPGGRLLLELQNRDRLLRLLNPGGARAVEVGPDLMLDTNTFDAISGRIETTRHIVRDGRLRRTGFSIRVFAFTEIRDWLRAAGFGRVEAFDRDGTPFTIESRRMAVLATR